MATPYSQQLSPEFLAQLRAYQGMGPTLGPDGNYYYGTSQQGGSSGSDNGPTGFYGITPEMAASNSGTYSAPTYDASGKQTGARAFKPDGTMSDLMGVLSVLGVAAGGAALAGSGAGAGAAGAGAGGGELATGGFLGEAPFTATGGGALDFGAAGAGAGGVGAGAGGAGAAGGAGGSSILGGSGAGAGSGLSGLLGSGAGLGSLVGPVLGGLLGSKPTTTSTSSTKNLPGYLQPSVDGLLAQTDALRNKQMTPGYMQGYDDMRTVGQNMLNQPIAGNGVGKVAYPTQFGFKR